MNINQSRAHTLLFVSFGEFVHTLINDEQFDEEKSFCVVDAELFFKIAKQNVKKITF